MVNRWVHLILFFLFCFSLLLLAQSRHKGECGWDDEGNCRGSSSTTSSSDEDDDEDQEDSSSVWEPPKDALEKAQKAAKMAKFGAGTRIISNFIQEPSLLEEMTQIERWYDCFLQTRGETTHWMDRDAVPKTWMEKLAVEMWKTQPIIDNGDADFAGYEIWCNLLSSKGPLDWHVDKDQIAYKESGGKNLSLPLYGSVFYGFPHDVEGGFLELVKLDPHDDEDNPDEDEVERIEAEYNRLIIFNASKFHRVAPIHRGIRVTLAVNIWGGRPRVSELDGANLMGKQ